jgi:hypothetical protein
MTSRIVSREVLYRLKYVNKYLLIKYFIFSTTRELFAGAQLVVYRSIKIFFPLERLKQRMILSAELSYVQGRSPSSVEFVGHCCLAYTVRQSWTLL